MIRFQTHNTTYLIYLCTLENDVLTTNVGVFHIRTYGSAHSHPSFDFCHALSFITFSTFLHNTYFIDHFLDCTYTLTDRTMQYCTYRTSTWKDLGTFCLVQSSFVPLHAIMTRHCYTVIQVQNIALDSTNIIPQQPGRSNYGMFLFTQAFDPTVKSLTALRYCYPSSLAVQNLEKLRT